MNSSPLSFAALLGLSDLIDVVDVGANPIDGDPPYKPLLDRGAARIFGFEPNPEALAKLNAMKGPNETYFPNAVYDGKEQILKVCASPGMTSLLEPNTELLANFHGMPTWGEVKERIPMATTRLDDIEGIPNVDYLKIDIQGGELEVFKNGVNHLSTCLVVHTEVEFLPMYHGQPLFSEVEQFLRSQGFVFHSFVQMMSRAVRPFRANGDLYGGFGQVFWSDAVFVKDFTKFDGLSPLQLKKVALILHDLYGASDLAMRALMELDRKSATDFAPRFVAFLSGTLLPE